MSAENPDRCTYCQSRRQFLGAGLALGVGLLLPATGEAAGRFRQFRGDIRVDGRKAHARTRILPDSLIEVKDGGEASLALGDNAFLLKPKTSVRFTRPVIRNSAVSGFRLISGAILGVFGPGPKTLHTNTATIGIRGTGVYFENRADSSYICLCYGALDLSAVRSPETMQAMSATHHAGRDVQADGKISDAPMLNHTDDELVMLEELVGRKPPFAAA